MGHLSQASFIQLKRSRKRQDHTSTWSYKVKLGGHVNAHPPMKQLNTVLWHS